MNKFDTFSDAFRYAVDNTGRKHSYFYKKIPMDKGQWSKIYHGDTENPQPPTRKKLTDVVGVKIVKHSKNEWEIIEQENRKENRSHEDNGVNSLEEQFRLAEEELDKVSEPPLDYLPQFVRLKDKLDAKIQKLIGKKGNDDD